MEVYGSVSALQLAVSKWVVCSPFHNKYCCFFKTACKMQIFQKVLGGFYLLGLGALHSFQT